MFASSEGPGRRLRCQAGYESIPEERLVSHTEFPAGMYSRITLGIRLDSNGFRTARFTRVRTAEELNGAEAYAHRTARFSYLETLPGRSWSSGETKDSVPISVPYFSKEIHPSTHSQFMRVFPREHDGPIPIFSHSGEALKDLMVLLYLALHSSPRSDDGTQAVCMSLTLKKIRGEAGTIYRHSLFRRQTSDAMTFHVTKETADVFFAYLALKQPAKGEYAEKLLSGKNPPHPSAGLERKDAGKTA